LIFIIKPNIFESRKFDEGIGVFESKEDLFWTRLYSEIHGDEFQISQTHRTISFDFETESELIEKLNHIKSFSFFEIYNRGIPINSSLTSSLKQDCTNYKVI
jgi:hypothetical protein